MRPNDNAATDELARLRALLESQLNDPDEGLVFCERRRRDSGSTRSASELFAELAQDLGRELRADRLVEMPREMAARVATEMFRGSFVAVTRGEQEAATDAEAFLALFGPGARFFSTYRYRVNDGGNLTCVGVPFLDNSIESGFFAIGSERFGCLWVGDED